MMLLKHETWENALVLSSERVSVIAIEDVSSLWEMCQELQAQIAGNEGRFLLFDDTHKQRSIAKEMFVEMNLTNIVINDKKLINSLQKRCAAEFYGHAHQELFAEITGILYQVCSEIANNAGLGCRTELNPEIDPSAVFKLFETKFVEDQKTLLEKLVDQISLHVEFFNTSIFVYLFPSKFLKPEELAKLYSHCALCGCALVFIEDTVTAYESSNLEYQAIIIDKDGCELTKNIDKGLAEIKIP